MEERPWLKWYPKEIPHHLQYEEVSLQETLRRTAKKFPDRPAVHFMGKEIPYRKLFESSLKLANYLRKIGLQKGDRVAVMLPNTPQTFISFYGILFAGGIVVQVNPLFTEREIAFQLKDAGAKFIIVLDMLFNRVKNVEKETDLRHIIVTGIKDYLPFPKNLLYPMVQKRQKTVPPKVEHAGRHHLFAEIMKRAEAKDIPDEVNPKEDVAILQYTGGTTGFPKGVMLTHFNLYANAKMCDAWIYKFKEGEGATLGVLPLFHVYGLTTVLVFPVMKGDMAILLPRFDAGEVLKTIDKLKPKVFPGAPTMYIGLLNHPDLEKYDLSSIEVCLSGSAPLPVEVQQQFEKLSGGKLVEGYGLTESSPVTHANFLWDNERVKGSIGVPWPDTDAKIVSLSTGETLPPGEIGELAVKGPQVMKGYWNRPEETEQALKDGWLMTGDLGYMDENGYFYIVDRKKDMIIAGGYNIYPREVEEVLYEHPAVKEAVVAGVPDPYRGETVKAYIVLKEGQRVTEEELDRFARKQLAAYKVPRIYEFRDELPKTAVGKILRRQLVEEEKRKLVEKEEKKA
ncbi:MAG: long-chain fatty acid--CoA ligase [Caldibacillus debilis]|uniref:Long-chain fatty acid--CoA ligase n=1 Tax=Caldibacillus debilis TaxID=301148 RepID=A0A3E0JWM4_9BACI|nr:long-chain-fatty-acid--CoA ligase [Caldibacillus debilis]REJ24434.1 MAG: long-chain fatty acid--CoA ligase [Caldibacillus debilis]